MVFVPGLWSGYEGMSTNLQATISAATAGGETIIPHHPITCQSKLYYNEDGSLECEHARTGADDPRTQAGLIHSVAILLIEEAFIKFGGPSEKGK